MNVPLPAQILSWLLLVTRQNECNKVQRGKNVHTLRAGEVMVCLLGWSTYGHVHNTNKHTQAWHPISIHTAYHNNLEHIMVLTYNSSNPPTLVEYFHQCFYSKCETRIRDSAKVFSSL